jgi:hypothetical protein
MWLQSSINFLKTASIFPKTFPHEAKRHGLFLSKFFTLKTDALQLADFQHAQEVLGQKRRF